MKRFNLHSKVKSFFKKLKTIAAQFNKIEWVAIGLIFCGASTLLTLSIYLIMGNKEHLITSSNKNISIFLSKDFINRNAQKEQLSPILLPELISKNIALLASTKDHSQIIYSYMVQVDTPINENDLESFTQKIRSSLTDNSQTSNVHIEPLNKKQIRFTANNSLNNAYFVESCLLTIREKQLVTICSRLKNEKNQNKARELLKLEKIKMTLENS